MVRIAVSIFILAWSTLSFAGHSYFGLSNEHVYYSEQYSVQGLAFRTSVSVNSPLLVSGGLYDINKRFSFSVDASSTLSPGDVKEKQLFDDPIIVELNNVDSVQVNEFSVAMANTQTLLHYRLTPHWSLLSGVGFDLHIFKRFGWKTQLQELSFDIGGETVQQLAIRISDTEVRPVNLPVGAVEQTTFTMTGLFGLAFATDKLEDHDWRVHFSALIGKPFIRSIENTLYPGVQFNGTGGHRYNITFGGSYKIFKGAHLGLEGYYSKIERSEELVEGVVAAKSETEIIRLTFAFLWKFD